MPGRATGITREALALLTQVCSPLPGLQAYYSGRRAYAVLTSAE
jgi:hypothetical protein